MTIRDRAIAALLLCAAATGCNGSATGLPEGDFAVNLAFILNPTRPVDPGGRELWAAALDGRLRWINRDRRPRPASPSVSPDGMRVVFSAPASEGAAADLFMAVVDSPETRILFSSPEPEENPLWSPDGTMIAFEGVRSGVREIFILALASKEVVRLASPVGDVHLGAWSPDSRRIAYSAPGDGGTQIEIASASGQDQRRLTGGPGVKEHPAWEPSGDSIAYISAGMIRLVGLSGFGDRVVAAIGDSILPPLQWKARGEAIIAAASVGGRTDIIRIDRKGGEPVNLTRLYLPSADPRMLRGGREFAYVADLGFARKIYLMDTEGFGNRALTPYYLEESELSAR